MPGTHPKSGRSLGKYSKEQLANALKEIRNGSSLRKASRDNGIPCTTLKRVNEVGLVREKTVLTRKEEEAIFNWIKECGRRGFGKTPQQIREAVKQVLDSAGRKVFQSNYPGKTWWYGF